MKVVVSECDKGKGKSTWIYIAP